MKARNLVAAAALFLCVQLVCPAALFAQSAPPPIDLDLTSTNANLSAGHLVQDHPVTINVGGQQVEVTNSSTLTPAERLAVWQVVSTQSQSIIIGQDGAATGGSMTLGAHASQYISGLNIPANVTVLSNVATSQGLALTGNLTNGGTMQFFSTDAAAATANVAANNIVNSGLLTTVLPQSGITGAISNLNLQLTALNNITNSGIISSAGNLSAIAGGAIVNSLPANVTGIQPIMQAVNNVNLTSNIGSIVNSGLINAVTGNINISSQIANNLVINNVAGQLQALNGSLNVRDSLFTGKYDLAILGGDIVASNLNLYTGQGTATVNVKELDGILNITGGAAHVNASTSTLELGSMALSGDPTFYNQGDILLHEDISFPGQDLAIISSANIIGAGAQIINTSSNNLGGSITLMAGTSFMTTGDPQALPPSPDTTSLITINGASSGGGKIDLASVPVNGISSVGAVNSGGNVTMVAYAGTRAGSGTISLAPTTTITTGSGGPDFNGDVVMVAGASSGTAIQTGSINTTGADNGTGKIYMLTSQASLTGCTGCTGLLKIVDGTIIEGHINTNNKQYPTTNANIIAGDLSSTGASIQLLAGGTVNVGTINTSGSNDSGVNGGIALLAGASSSTSIQAGNLTTSNGTGGNIFILTSRPDLSTPCTSCILTNRQANASGNVTLSNATASGNIDFRIGGDLEANTLTSLGDGQAFGGTVGLQVNNVPGGTDTFMVGGAGSNAVQNITVKGGSNGGGTIAITSRSTGGINIVSQSALTINKTAGQGAAVGINAIAGTLTTSGLWNMNGSVEGDGGFLNLAAQNITFTTPVSMTANATVAGNGGTIQIHADNNVDLSASDTNIQANGIGDNGSGGLVSLTSGSDIYLGTSTVIKTLGSGTGYGGQITLASAGALDMAAGPVSLTATAVDAQGGVIVLAGSSITMGESDVVLNANSTSQLAGAITINATALTTGAGTFYATANSTMSFGGSIDMSVDNITTGAGAIHLDANSDNDFGGSIFLYTPSVNLGTGRFTASARGALGGGYISAFVDSMSGQADMALSADAAGTQAGDGGVINLSTITSNAGLVLGNQTGQINLSANGYSSTGANAKGGYISVSTGGDLTLSGPGLTVLTNAANGDGGQIDLFAGTGGQGTMLLNGNVEADATGTGNGGIVNISAGGDLNIGAGSIISAAAQGQTGSGGTINLIAGTGNSGALTIDGSVSANGGAEAGDGGSVLLTYNGAGSMAVNGVVSADAFGGGNGGSISVNNSAQAPLNIVLNGTFSANSENGSVGTLSFSQPGQAVVVSGTGSITGTATALGSSVTFDLSNPNSVLSINSITATAGDINLTAGSIVSGQDLASAQVTASANINLVATTIIDPLDFTGVFVNLESPTIDARNINASGGLTLKTTDGPANQIAGGTWTAPRISFESTSGSLGTLVNPIRTVTSFLTVNTGADANAFVENTGSLSIHQSTVGGAFSVTNSEDIATDGPISVNDLLLTANNNGSISIGAAISALATVVLKTDGSGSVNAGANSLIQADLLTINTQRDIGTPIFPLLTEVSTLSARSTGPAGSVFIFQQGRPINLDQSSAGDALGSVFHLASTEDITVTNAIKGDTINLQGYSGSDAGITIARNGFILATTNANLLADGAGNITRSADSQNPIDAPNVTLSSGSGSIGATARPILTAADNLTVQTAGNVAITQTKAVNLQASSAGPEALFALAVMGNLNVSGAVSAQDVALETVADISAVNTNGNINLAATVVGTGFISLTTNGFGNITQAAGIIAGGSLNLASTAGNFGSSTSGLATSIQSVAAHTGGSVYLVNDQNTTINESVVGQAMQISTAIGSNGNIQINGDISALELVSLTVYGSGDITASGFSTGNGALIAPRVILSAENGNIGQPGSTLPGSGGTAITTVADSLQVATNSGSVFVQNIGDLQLAQATAGQLLEIACTGSMSFGSTLAPVNIRATNISLSTIAGDGAIILAGSTMVATNSLQLTAAGYGNIEQNRPDQIPTAPTLLAAPYITLSTTNGSIGSLNQYIQTRAIATLTAQASESNGSVFVNQIGDITLAGSAGTGNSSVFDVRVSESANLIVNSASGDAVKLESSGNMTIGGDVSGRSLVMLISDTGSIFRTDGTVAGNNVALIANGSNIGSPTAYLVTNATNLQVAGATQQATHQVYIHNTGGPVHVDPNPGSVFTLINDGGDIFIDGPLSENRIVLQTAAGSGGSIVVNAPLMASNAVELTADTGIFIGSNVIVSASSGSIGLQGVSISNSGLIQASNSITLASNKNLTISGTGNFTAGGAISINALGAGASVVVVPGSTINIPSNTSVNIAANGAYIATGSVMNLNANAGLLVQANSINTGSVIGGNSTSFYATNNLVIDGNISVPNGTLFLAGKSIDSIAGISVNAPRARIVPQGDRLITLVGTGGSPGAGLNITAAFLSNMSGGSVEIGETSLMSGINVVGNIDLAAAHFGGLVLRTGGAYSGTGSVLSLGPTSGLELQANSINTGSIIDGYTTSFYANNQLMVDGNISVPNGTLLFVGKSIDASANISANAVRVRLIPSIDEPITLVGSGGSFGTGMNITSAFLNNISAGSVEIGVTSLMSGFNVVGNVDLSAAHFGVLVLLNNGAYTATGSILTLAPSSGLQVQAGTINTGSILGGRQVELFANNSIKIDGDLIGTPAISIGGSSITSDNVAINSSFMRLSAGAINLQPAQFNGGLVAISSTDFNFHTGSGALGISAIVSTGSVVIRNDSGSVSIGATGSIQSLAGDILIESASLSLGHNSVTGNTVTLRPSIDVPIAVGSLAAGTGPFAISAADLGNITAQTVVIGGTIHGGGFNVLGNVNVSGSGPAGAFNLVFNNRDTYDGSAGTITLGNKTLTINVSALQLGPISSTGGGINIASAGNIVINQAISIGTGALSLSTLPGSNGNIVLNANISAGSLLAITADGAGSIQGTGLLQAANISLVSGTGNIGTSSANIQTACASLDAHTGGAGNVYISQNGDVIINDSSAGSVFSVSANGSLKTAGVVTAASVILQSTNGGTVTIDPDIIGTSSVVISVNGSGRIVQFPNTVISTQALTLQADLGDIGDALHPLLTEAQSMTIHTGGSATIYQSGDLSLGSSSIGNSLQLQVAGNLAVDGAVTGTNLLFSTTSTSNGNIALNGNVAATAAIQMVAGGAGNVVQASGVVVSAPVVSISSSTGSLGSATADLLIAATSLSLNTGGAGDVNARTVGDTTLLASSAGGDFTFSSGGSLLVAGDVLTSSGNLSLTADQGGLTVGGIHITANEGNLYLANTNSTSGSILIQPGAVLTARSVQSSDYGHVYLSVGELDDHVVRGRVPKNITINRTNGGQVYFGSAGIIADGTNNVINLVHSTVVFDTGTRPASAIELDGNTTINATSVNGGEYTPVNFVELAGCVNNNGLEAACLDSACVWTCKDANVGLNSAGKLVLHSGEILISAKKQVTIETGKCQVQLQKGTVALIKRSGSNVSAKFLHDNCGGSASIFHKGAKIAILMPGQEFIFADSNDDAMGFLEADNVARRKVRVEHSSAEMSIMTSEFSIMAAISKSKALKGLMMISRKEERQVAATVLRTAACLNIVNASHGSFSMK